MTDLTKNRGYPFPSSERETGNGGLFSELLARAVAADLDAVDRDWAAELQHSTMVLNMSADLTPLTNGTEYSVFFNTLEKRTTGLGLKATQLNYLTPDVGGEGWYHVIATCQSKANGTITAGAQHRMHLNVNGDRYGAPFVKRTYYFNTFQRGTLDNYMGGEAVVHLGTNESMRMGFFHLNTGSDARVVAAGTRLTATLLVRDE